MTISIKMQRPLTSTPPFLPLLNPQIHIFVFLLPFNLLGITAMADYELEGRGLKSTDDCYPLSWSSCTCNRLTPESGCRYNQRTAACVSKEEICAGLTALDTACLVNGYHYAVGGSPCKWEDSTQECKRLRTVLAVNINGEHYTDTESGIVYEAGKIVPFTDPAGSRHPARIPESEATEELKKVYELFGSYMTTELEVSRDDALKGVCLNYDLNGLTKGYYEAILHFVEPLVLGKNTFDVRFNNIIVLKSFNIYRYGGDRKPLTVVVRFHVVQTNEGQSLKILGQPDSKIKDGFLPLSICFGCCKEDNQYRVSGLAVVQIKPNKELPQRHPCESLGNQCQCRENACEFDAAGETCSKLGDKCAELGFDFEDDECVRESSFYGFGGTFCGPWAPSPEENCELDMKSDNVFNPVAINFNGGRFVDEVTGINYEADSKSYDINSGLKIFHGSSQELSSMNGLNTPVFQNYIVGERGDKPGKQCLRYYFTILKPGRYELTLKMPEPYYKGPRSNKRSFNVFLAGVEIVAEINLNRHLAFNTGGDFIIHFKMKPEDDHIYVKGFAPRYIKDRNNVPLEFCPSNCNFIDTNFVVSAFSLQRFRDTQARNLVMDYYADYNEMYDDLPTSGRYIWWR